MVVLEMAAAKPDAGRLVSARGVLLGVGLVAGWAAVCPTAAVVGLPGTAALGRVGAGAVVAGGLTGMALPPSRRKVDMA